MSVVTQGTAHLFGIQGGVAVITNATVVSFSPSTAYANEQTTVNEIGNVIEDRMDDLTIDATIVLRPQAAFTPFVPGDKLTYETVDYVVKSVAKPETSGGFVEHSYALKSYEYITEA